MASIGSVFRKYHRQLSIILSLPLILMAITGTISPILEALRFESAAEFVRKVHSGKIFFGTAYLIYAVLSGLGLLGLLVTGLSMLRLSSRHKRLKIHLKSDVKILDNSRN